MVLKTMSSNELKQRWGTVMSTVDVPDDTEIVESHGKPRAAVISSETTIAELKGKILSKPYLTSRLPDEVVDPFIHLLRSVAVIVPEIEEDVPAVSRDRKDDYLLMHAVIEDAHYLVTGDKDLLVLGTVARRAARRTRPPRPPLMEHGTPTADHPWRRFRLKGSPPPTTTR